MTIKCLFRVPHTEEIEEKNLKRGHGRLEQFNRQVNK